MQNRIENLTIAEMAELAGFKQKAEKVALVQEMAADFGREMTPYQALFHIEKKEGGYLESLMKAIEGPIRAAAQAAIAATVQNDVQLLRAIKAALPGQDTAGKIAFHMDETGKIQVTSVVTWKGKTESEKQDSHAGLAPGVKQKRG